MTVAVWGEQPKTGEEIERKPTAHRFWHWRLRLPLTHLWASWPTASALAPGKVAGSSQQLHRRKERVGRIVVLRDKRDDGHNRSTSRRYRRYCGPSGTTTGNTL